MTANRILVCATLLAAPLAAQQFQLKLARDILGQKSIRTLAGAVAGDLNGDGRVDLLFADNAQYASHERLYLNHGATFAPSPLGVPAGSNGKPTLLDIDGDGDLDVLHSSGQMRLLRNDGTGGMTDISATHLPAGVVAFGRAATSDIDGDGDLDVLLTQGKVLVNDGTGVFADMTATQFFGNGFAIGLEMVVADFDADGDDDFVIMTGLHRNNGAGVFTIDPTANIQHGYGEIPFAFDVDMDGDIDVVTTAGRQLRNDGAGVFTELPNFLPPALPNQQPPWYIGSFADLNGDRAWDVLLSPSHQSFGTSPAWAANNGQGTFDFAQVTALPCEHGRLQATLAADLDGDGDNDLVVTDAQSLTPSPAEVLFNDGLGNFHNATELGGLAAPGSFGRIVADIDNDGDDDIVTDFVVSRNDGKGKLTTVLLPSGMMSVLIADFDGDGRNDSLGSQAVWLSEGGLQYTQGPLLVAANEHIIDAIATDIDADGDLDIVMTAGAWSAASSGRVLRNDGAAMFTAIPPASIGLTTASARLITAGDFNGDGHDDLFFGYYYQWPTSPGPSVQLFLSDGTGQFSATPTGLGPFGSNRVLAADFEGDGDLDFLTASSQTLQVNDGTGQFTAHALAPMSSYRTHLDDVDLDGDIDIWTNGTGWPTLYINDGNNNFASGSARLDPEQAPHSAPEFVLLDLDRDGDRDVLIIAKDAHTQAQYYVPMWNHLRHLRAPNLTTIGGTLDLFVSAIEAPATPFAVVGVATAEVQIPTQFGLLGINPNHAILITAPMTNGSAELNLSIPNNSALLGLPLHAQALLVATTRMHLTGTVTSRITP